MLARLDGVAVWCPPPLFRRGSVARARPSAVRFKAYDVEEDALGR